MSLRTASAWNAPHRVIPEPRVERANDLSAHEPCLHPGPTDRAARQRTEEPPENAAVGSPANREDPEVHLAQVHVETEQAELQIIQGQRQDLATPGLRGHCERDRCLYRLGGPCAGHPACEYTPGDDFAVCDRETLDFGAYCDLAALAFASSSPHQRRRRGPAERGHSRRQSMSPFMPPRLPRAGPSNPNFGPEPLYGVGVFLASRSSIRSASAATSFASAVERARR